MRKLLLTLLLFTSCNVFSQGVNGENKVGIKSSVSPNQINNSVGIDAPMVRPSGVTYSTEASQYFNRMTVKPSADTLLIMAEFIDSLKLCGVWDKLDVLCLLANSDTTNALLNLKGSSFTGIRIGSPVFVPYKGITGATNKYINTQYNPSIDTTNKYFKLNSLSYGIFSNTNSNGNYADMGGSNQLTAMIGNNGGVFTSYCNGIFETANIISSIGNYACIRIGSDITQYKDGTLLTMVSSGVISNSKTTEVFFVGCRNNGGTPTQFTDRQYALYYIGGGLTAQNVIDFNSAVTKLKTKIGF